ncbi:uncharacterized protein [Nicotiana sylvestris]|uniref:Uncharacterized protein isoform X3 n=2 Tax=Nicotiana TaxID=4085 RepID=A0A1S3WX88_TOBAC|nr:PREDICTED: uncharacterized protein LOC104213036 isoform X3 [Nicotiana sylvestris]XP_016432283.1 PREDICTED: uncharacterized protein LOC107758948 isoform X3 [Nicotiana tabacum]
MKLEMTNGKRKTLCDFFPGSDEPRNGKVHECGPRNANLREAGSSNFWKEHVFKEETAYRAMARFFCQSGYDAYFMDVREPDSHLTSLESDLVNALMSTKSWFDKQRRNAMKAEGSAVQNN